MKGALDIHRELLALDVPHEIVRLRRIALHGDELPDALGLDPDQCIVVRMYEADGRLIAVLVPAGRTPDPAAVLNAVGARALRPAPPDRVSVATDYAAGLVAPLLLPSGLRVLADETFLRSDVVYAPTGDTGTALGIHATDLVSLSGAQVVDLAHAPVIDLTGAPVDLSS